jgi:hypothetical protein
MRKLLKIVGIAVVGLIALGVVIGMLADGDDTTTKKVVDDTAKEVSAKVEPKKDEVAVSLAEFDQIKAGMSYEEVVKIVGGEGTIASESGEEGDQLHTILYQYEGDGDLGANASFMFQGGKLENKTQIGLK